jgi:3-phosphoglycerate kinase
MAIYFLAAKGVKTGKTVLDEKVSKKVSDLIKTIESKKIQLILPVDHIVSEEPESESGVDLDVQVVPASKYVVDIGEKTLVLFREVIESAKTVVWYGPVGKFEIEAFNRGTEAIGEYIALSAGKDCIKYALGTSTLVAINKLKVKHKRFNCLVPNAEAFLNQ